MGELARRTGLGTAPLTALSQAGAFECLGVARRAALWDALAKPADTLRPLPLPPEEAPAFTPLDAFQTIGWDYDATAHSARGHPLSAVREQLTARGLPDARTLAARPHGERVRYAGLVICRQRPGTASGVTFMTLEDETGFVNLVLWKQVFDAHAVIAKTATFLGVTGRLQSEQGVVHVIVDQVWVPEVVAPTEVGSRDFH